MAQKGLPLLSNVWSALRVAVGPRTALRGRACLCKLWSRTTAVYSLLYVLTTVHLQLVYRLHGCVDSIVLVIGV